MHFLWGGGDGHESRTHLRSLKWPFWVSGRLAGQLTDCCQTTALCRIFLPHCLCIYQQWGNITVFAISHIDLVFAVDTLKYYLYSKLFTFCYFFIYIQLTCKESYIWWLRGNFSGSWFYNFSSSFITYHRIATDIEKKTLQFTLFFYFFFCVWCGFQD